MAILLGLAAAMPVAAQNTSAGLAGRVVDESGAPIANATVEIVHAPTGSRKMVVTDANGRYSAVGLRVGGPYTVTVSKNDLTDAESDVYLALAGTTNVDAQLSASSANATELESVTVTADALSYVFSPDKMGSGTSITRQDIENLPSMNGNIQDYMRLDPRVAFSDRSAGSITAGGQNPRFNKITIDGVSASDTFGLDGNNMPTQRQPVSMEAIEAIDLNLSNYDVIYSGAAGVNVNAVTKSGTNEFHGSVYGYYRDSEWFGEFPARVAGSTTDVTGLDFDEFDHEQTYGMTFGGPIVQDRLFFFANYEKFERTEIGPAGRSLGTTPLAGAADFDADDVAEVQRIARELYGFDAGGLTAGDTELEEKAVKLDWSINDDHRASIRYSALDQSRVRPEASSASVLSLSSNWFTQDKTVESYVGQLYSDWSDSFSTEFKASYRNYDSVRVTPTTAPVIQIYFEDGNPTNLPTAGDLIRIGSERSSMGNTLLTETLNYFGAATWSLDEHDIKFGAEYSDNDIYNYFLQDSYGNYSFYGIENFRNGIYFDYDLQYQTSPGSVPAEYANKNLGMFVQDTWFVNSNLTLTYGVRLDEPKTSPDPIFNPTFASPQTISAAGRWTGGFGLDNTNTYGGGFIVQPRVGFNYTFDSVRRTQLRGGFGLFQGDAPQVWVGNAYNTTGLNYIAYSNYRNCAYTGPAPSGANATCLNDLFNPNGLNPTIPPSSSANRNVNVIAEGFELPSVWKANLALDHELPWYGITASAEVLLTQVENGLFYRSLNTGPGFLGPDGRVLYWNPNSPRPFGNTSSGATATNPARFNNNSFFGDVYLLENTNKGDGEQVTLSLSKPFSEDDWSWTLGYTYTQANEVGALTSSTASSGYGGQLSFNINDAEATTARYEIRDRISGALNWKHMFFGDNQTQVGLFYEGRSGRPFSYIFTGDANGDNRPFNDLFYVPTGPGDVAFGTMNGTTGAFTANPAFEAAFFEWLSAHPELEAYAGSYAPENAFRADWVNTVDLRLSQEISSFFDGHKAEVWIDIQNFGNMLNKDWGNIIDYGFNANVAVATLVGIDPVTGRYVYGPRSGTEFGQASALGLPTNADSQTDGISQWSVQVGFRYEF
ncbi:MAG TPA: TonB-dependent receptor [Pseudomonadota bacterium]|nr:TonB-dependent receptor [Pseudomonadota bacterium]